MRRKTDMLGVYAMLGVVLLVGVAAYGFGRLTAPNKGMVMVELKDQFHRVVAVYEKECRV
jgi:hypothetical protein